MIVTCPQCATQYNLPESSVREGAKARCAQCKTIFIIHVQAQPQCASQRQASSQQLAPQYPPQQAQQIASSQGQTQNPQYRQGPAKAIVADGLPPLPSLTRGPQQQGHQVHQAHQMESQAPQPHLSAQYVQPQHIQMGHPMGDVASLTGQANLARQPHSEQGRSVQNSSSQAHTPASPLHSGQAPHDEQHDAKPTAFQSFVTALLFLAIFAMLGYGAWRYMPRLGNDQLEAEANRIAHVSDQIKDIALHNVRQYTVQSSKAGLLLVIEGRIINNFRSPREMVKVEAALYDKDGKRLESKQQLCGVLIPKLQMQIWDAREIEAALDNELEAYAHNVNIASGTSVPFMIIFVNPPASVASYGVHVVDAQIPPNYK